MFGNLNKLSNQKVYHAATERQFNQYDRDSLKIFSRLNEETTDYHSSRHRSHSYRPMTQPLARKFLQTHKQELPASQLCTLKLYWQCAPSTSLQEAAGEETGSVLPFEKLRRAPWVPPLRASACLTSRSMPLSASTTSAKLGLQAGGHMGSVRVSGRGAASFVACFVGHDRKAQDQGESNAVCAPLTGPAGQGPSSAA